MLRAVLSLLNGTAASSMTELDAVQCRNGVVQTCAAAVPAEQASSLITSTTRKVEKRKADLCSTHPCHKRQKQSPGADQAVVCLSDVSREDQENDNEQHKVLEQSRHNGRSSLGTMLAPLYEWLQQGTGQQQCTDPQQTCTAPGAPSAPSAPSEQQQPQQQREEQQQEQQAGEASGSENTYPSSSSLPTVSQSCAHAPVCEHGCHQRFLQQEGQLYHNQQQQQPQQQQYQSSSADESADDIYDDEDFDPLLFIGTLGPVEHYVAAGRQPLLPKQTRMCKQKTLVLDLDETLVHSTLDAACGIGADFSFPVVFNGAEHMVHVRQRPHMRKFLERVAALFEVVVFTASQKVYAERLLNIIDPQRCLIRHRIYRDSCVLVEGNYLKDLTVLGRDLSRCAIVDNSPQAFGFQVANGIPIESFYDDPDDNELVQLLPFLESIASTSCTDVRPAIISQFGLPGKVQEAMRAASQLVRPLMPVVVQATAHTATTAPPVQQKQVAQQA